MKKIMLSILIVLSIFILTSCEKIRIINEDKNVTVATKARVKQLYKDNNSTEDFIYKSDSQAPSIGMYMSPETNSFGGEMSANLDMAAPSSDEGETSKTNVVIEGVDEADYIKNDNRYLYYIPSFNDYFYYGYGLNLVTLNQNINVIDSSTDEVSSIKINGKVKGMYLNEAGLTVIYEQTIYDKPQISNKIDINYYSSHRNLVIANYDNSDPMNLKLNKEIKLYYTTYNDSRMIDNKLYLIGNLYLFDENDVRDLDYQIDGNEEQFSYSDICILENSNYGRTSLSLYAIDLAKEDEIINFKSFYGLTYGYYTQFHLNLNNLYIYTSSYFSYYGSKQFTKIIRISLEDFEIKGTVEQRGSLCDVYAIDEYDGVLRVATTYTEKDYKDYHNLLVTYDVKTKFDKIADIEFAEGENIYSTKFVKNMGYIVTYLYIDPLFEFDLTDPADIKINRSLKSPGVSDYLDYINEDFILGIGRMTEEHDTYATSDGVKVSLFSLDGEDMVEEDTYLYGKSSYTTATYNHKEIIKLPQSLCYYFPIQIYNNQNNVNGFTGIRVNLETREIEYLGAINLEAYNTRLVVINGKIYAVGNNSVSICMANANLSVIKEIK